MVPETTYYNIRTWLDPCQRPLVVAHRRPDGDAIGAVAGMTLALQQLGRDPLPTLYEPFPERYALLADRVPWYRWDEQQEMLRTTCDAVIILDTCSGSQLGPIAAFLPQAPRTLVIDHHPTRENIALRKDDLRVFDESAGAVCLLIAEWITTVGLPWNERLATPLFVGLATDTGWFRFPNTDARALRMAATLIDAGAPSAEIYHAVYQQEPTAKLRLIGRMLTTLELHADDRLAVMRLRLADFQAAGADRTMTEDLVNEATRIGSTEATLLFCEEADGTVRVNFRSKRTLDVSALAAQFGGGGHTRAAGARPQGDWDTLTTRIIAATIAALEHR